jgi:hypothetical protein
MKTKTKTPERAAATPSRRQKPDNPEQFERFVDAARKAGVDENAGTLDRALDKIISHSPRKGEL